MKMNFKQNSTKLAIAAGILVGSIGLSSASYAAGTDSENLTVETSVGEACNITTTALTFAAYSGAQLDGTGTVTHTCTHSLSADITMGVGSNQDGSDDAAPVRQMKHGVDDFLKYLLYSDSVRSTIWGNDSNSDKTITGTGTATPVTIYGRISENQTVPAGSYSDTVSVTISF